MENTGKTSNPTNKKAYRSLWLDRETYSLVKEWAKWEKRPFKKALKLKRALSVLLYCGVTYYFENREDGDLRYPDVFQMQQRFDKRSPFDFSSKRRRLNYKLIWLDTESYFILKEISRILALPMKQALPIVVDWGFVFYSVKMLSAGAMATKDEDKLQELIFASNFPIQLKETMKMLPPFLHIYKSALKKYSGRDNKP